MDLCLITIYNYGASYHKKSGFFMTLRELLLQAQKAEAF
jgi:hypothetical protein